MPKGIPTTGKRAAGGGRKAHPVPLVSRTVTIEQGHVDYLRATFGTVSAGVRLLTERAIAVGNLGVVRGRTCPPLEWGDTQIYVDTVDS